MPIFQGGKIVGNLRFTQAEQTAAAFMYQQVVLNAIQDAESALISYKQQIRTTSDLSSAVIANENKVELSKECWIKGLNSKIDFLNSEKGLIQAKLGLLTSDTSALLFLISLYKALGGGWECGD
jgi:outer membrane protein, multidrug efflux system